MIKLIGKKILTGSFDMAKISFPIYCMKPRSMIESITATASKKHIYLLILRLIFPFIYEISSKIK